MPLEGLQGYSSPRLYYVVYCSASRRLWSLIGIILVSWWKEHWWTILSLSLRHFEQPVASALSCNSSTSTIFVRSPRMDHSVSYNGCILLGAEEPVQTTGRIILVHIVIVRTKLVCPRLHQWSRLKDNVGNRRSFHVCVTWCQSCVSMRQFCNNYVTCNVSKMTKESLFSMFLFKCRIPNFYIIKTCSQRFI